MKHEVIKRTARDVAPGPEKAEAKPNFTREELCEAVILISARLELARTRAW